MTQKLMDFVFQFFCLLNILLVNTHFFFCLNSKTKRRNRPIVSVAWLTNEKRYDNYVIIDLSKKIFALTEVHSDSYLTYIAMKPK